MGLFAGYLGDKVIQDWDWSPLMVRRIGQSVGSFGLGVFLLLAVKLARTATMAMILVTIGMALNGFTMIGASVYQVNIIVDIAKELFMSIVDRLLTKDGNNELLLMSGFSTTFVQNTLGSSSRLGTQQDRYRPLLACTL